MLRELIGNSKNKLIAFDVFNDNFPNTKYANEKNKEHIGLKQLVVAL